MFSLFHFVVLILLPATGFCQIETGDAVVVAKAIHKEADGNDHIELPIGTILWVRDVDAKNKLLNVDYFEPKTVGIDDVVLLDDAVEYFGKRMKESPDDPMWHIGLANSYRFFGDNNNAIDTYQRCLELKHRRSDVYYELAALYFANDKQSEAYSHAMRARITDTGNWRASYLLGLIWDHPDFDKTYPSVRDERKFRMTEALESFNRSVSLNPRNKFAYFARGKIYHRQRKFNKAVESFSSAIEIDSRYSAAYIERGISKTSLDRLESAIQDFSEAIEIQADAAGFNNRAWAHLLNKEHAKAIKDASSSIDLSPTISSYLTRGQAFLALGKVANATNDFKAALELDSNDKFARQMLNNLSKTEGKETRGGFEYYDGDPTSGIYQPNKSINTDMSGRYGDNWIYKQYKYRNRNK